MIASTSMAGLTTLAFCVLPLPIWLEVANVKGHPPSRSRLPEISFFQAKKTYTRKLYEVLLAFKIESNLSKDQIFELYINQIFLGQRAYGFAAAAQIYYGKPLKDISIAEAAMLAGLPKAPSAYNPIVNPKRAKIRQQYVLRRMHDLGYINDTQFVDSTKETLVVKRELADYSVHAEFIAEMARQITAERFSE
jgi:penicillin-binding protein 1A